MNKQPNSRMCFICGKQNIAGVNVSFYEPGDGRATPAASTAA